MVNGQVSMLLTLRVDLTIWPNGPFSKSLKKQTRNRVLVSIYTYPFAKAYVLFVVAINVLQETIKLKEELYEIIAKHSGKTYEQINEDSDRDFWMRADEALKYGMIDEVLTRDN